MRSIVVNLGVYWHFAGDISPPVWALCLFVLPFSFAIAVLKDVPDLEGDRRFAIRTFTVRLGPERVFGIGLGALAIAYGGMILLAPLAAARLRPTGRSRRPAISPPRSCSGTGPDKPIRRDRDGFTRFYMRVWALFFLEYLLVPAACLALLRRQVQNKLISWPKRRGQASTGGVGLSAMSIASRADQQHRAGRHSGDPHQAFRPQSRAEHHHCLPGARRTAARGKARRASGSRLAARDLRPATLSAGRRPRRGVPASTCVISGPSRGSVTL